MVSTHDIAVLCAAIDGGDDAALPILADALEEAGDARAAGLRETVAAVRYVWPDGPGFQPGLAPDRIRWGWWRHQGHISLDSCARTVVRQDVFARLPGATEAREWKFYPTRSAAYLALAEALAT